METKARGSSLCCITGATDGIGLHTATRLAVNGFDLIIHGRYVHKLLYNYLQPPYRWGVDFSRYIPLVTILPSWK